MLHAKATLRAEIRRLEEYLKTETNVVIICDINEQIEEHRQAIALVENLVIADVVVPKGTLCDYCKKPIESTCCNDCLEEMNSHNH